MTILITAIVIFFLMLALQGLFAGYETGFVSTNPIRIRHLAEEEGIPRAKRLLRHINEPGQMLTTLLIGTNLAVVAGTLAWLVVTVALGVWYRPTRAGRKVAYLTLVSFVLLLVALGVMLLADTQHGGGGPVT